jgi:hypothetical protein
MAQEPDGPAHLYHALSDRLQNNDKDGAIELYYELLSSGHSVGEILNGVDPVRSKAEQRNTAIAEPPRSEAEEAATGLACEAVLAEAAPAGRSGASDPSGPCDADGVEAGGTGEPGAAGNAPRDAFGPDNRERRQRESPSEAEPDIAGPAGVYSSKDAEAAFDAGNRERPWSGKFPGIVKTVAFWALCTGAIASASIDGFAILRREHRTEPAIARVQPTASGVSGTEAAAVPEAAADRSGAVAQDLEPGKPAASAGASPASEPSAPGEAEPEVSRAVSAGVPETASASRPEADAPRPSNAVPPAAIEETTPSAAPRNPAPASPTVAVQFPPATPTGSAETAPHPDTEQPAPVAKPEAASNGKPPAISPVPATAPTRNAAVPPRARPAERSRASTPRPHAEPRRYVRRRTPARHPQSAYNGRGSGPYYSSQQAGSSYIDSGRGYGYGAYGPAPYADTGN